jgi:hypothetical protein
LIGIPPSHHLALCITRQQERDDIPPGYDHDNLSYDGVVTPRSMLRWWSRETGSFATEVVSQQAKNQLRARIRKRTAGLPVLQRAIERISALKIACSRTGPSPYAISDGLLVSGTGTRCR